MHTAINRFGLRFPVPSLPSLHTEVHCLRLARRSRFALPPLSVFFSALLFGFVSAKD